MLANLPSLKGPLEDLPSLGEGKVLDENRDGPSRGDYFPGSSENYRNGTEKTPPKFWQRTVLPGGPSSGMAQGVCANVSQSFDYKLCSRGSRSPVTYPGGSKESSKVLVRNCVATKGRAKGPG